VTYSIVGLNPLMLRANSNIRWGMGGPRKFLESKKFSIFFKEYEIRLEILRSFSLNPELIVSKK